MQLHTISSQQDKKKKRVGRGGKRGTYSGRGIKGQRSRAGRRIRPQLRDILKKIPKKRGYKFKSFRIRPRIVNVSLLNMFYTAGEVVSPRTLAEKGILKQQSGSRGVVKILGNGNLTKKLTVEGCDVSTLAKEKIEKVGGAVQDLKT
jgi:large subunit ribosomal protein L15